MISKSYVTRLFIYLPVFLYLLGDIFVFKGPIGKKLDAMNRVGVSERYAEQQGVAASVLGKGILITQVDWAVDAYLFRNGQKRENIKPKLLKTLRLAMLNDLIDAELLRSKVHYNQKDHPVSEEEIAERYAHKLQAFASEQEYLELLYAQGVANKEEAKTRLKAQLQQEKYLQYIIAPALELSEEELLAFYERERESFRQPVRYKVRHIFLSTTDKAPKDVDQAMDKLIADVNQGADFAKVAESSSEDDRSKRNGGNLGWIADNTRVLAAIRQALMGMKVGERKKVRSSIGWHYMELMQRSGSEILPFKEVKEEIRIALQAKRRDQAIRRHRQTVRYRQRPYIKVYADVL